MKAIRTLLRIQELESDERSKSSSEIKAEVARLRKSTDPDLLDLYDYLKQRQTKPALAKVSEGYCGCCQMRVPMVVESTLRREVDYAKCDSCHRLLYLPEWLTRAQEESEASISTL